MIQRIANAWYEFGFLTYSQQKEKLYGSGTVGYQVIPLSHIALVGVNTLSFLECTLPTVLVSHAWLHVSRLTIIVGILSNYIHKCAL